MDLARLTTCLLFVATLYGSPGPATISLASVGATVGFRRSRPYLCGIVVGLAVNFLVAMLGVAVLLERAPRLVTVLQYASLAYILYLAVRIVQFDGGGQGTTTPLAFRDGVLLNVLNPKAYFAALAVLAQFGADDARTNGALLLLVVGAGLVIDVAWCFGGSLVGRATTSRRSLKRVRVALAAVLVGCAVFATFGS